MANKYGNKKPIVDGIKFDSKKEAKRYIVLKQMESKGEISELTLQKKYILIPSQYEESTEIYTKGKNKGQPKRGALIERECAYYADFDYYKNGAHVVEDVKGMKLPEYKIKRKLMLYLHHIRIKEV